MVVRCEHGEYGFDLRKFEITPTEVNIRNNYNDDLLPINDLIIDFLKADNGHGLILLHGKYDTGKTSYLRHLINNINKRIIFLPIELMDAICSPNFLPFISEFKDSILIIEDCEDLLRPRDTENNRNNGIVNLLNLGDGLMADALAIKIICTFNADLKHIDKAILRKGRLIARYDFQELSAEKAQCLSDKLGFNSTIELPMTLADIYNQDKSDFQLNQHKSKVGFKP